MPEALLRVITQTLLNSCGLCCYARTWRKNYALPPLPPSASGINKARGDKTTTAPSLSDLPLAQNSRKTDYVPSAAGNN
ncbi:hypothetical protein NPIL_268811 [Nephila pilipes]|uniref:Uncharacterized protein n=1 Tax=Nephila pilipes TaxID=299642 RepID=A0A8X6NIV1_NEPPI|nr:hypothetical protein NPIL_268811 [Nephila pilipes]